MRKRDRRMSSRGEIKKSPLSSRGGLIKVRDNKRQEGSPGTREGRTARKQNERLKIPSSRHNGILSRHLRPFFPFPPLTLSLLFLSFRGNSAYRARKQIKLCVKRKMEIRRFSSGAQNYPWKRRRKSLVFALIYKIINKRLFYTKARSSLY